MVNNSVLKLEDDNLYYVVDKLKHNDFYFVYLTNTNDSEDFCIRKEIEVNEEKILVGLDNEDELKFALKLFEEKNK